MLTTALSLVTTNYQLPNADYCQLLAACHTLMCMPVLLLGIYAAF